ncbi:MAG: hypothetical protein R3290_05050 [Acidimicrobiia bacterium]|nr:hypothetical protein [Acidimicrobiia bacterium]
MPLSTFGTHQPVEIRVLDPTGAPVGTLPVEDLFPEGVFEVGPAEPECTRQGLEFAPGLGPPVDGIRGLFDDLGATPEETTMVVEWGAVGLDGLGDPFRFSAPSGPPTIEGGFGDILTVGSSQVTFDASGESPIALDCATPGVLCGGRAPVLDGGDYHVLWFETAAPFPPPGGFQSQQAIVFNDSIGEPWQHVPDFPWDTFNGAAVWMFVDTPLGGGPPVFSASVAQGGTTVAPLATDAFAYVMDDTFAVFVPRAEFPTISGFGAAVHFHDGSFGFQPSDLSILDSAPDTNGPWTRGPGDLFAPMPVGDMDHVVTGIPDEVPEVTTTTVLEVTPTTQPEATATTLPEVTPTTQPESTPTSVPEAGPPPETPQGDDGGGPPWGLIIGGGIVIIGGGGYLLTRRSGAEPTPTTEEEPTPEPDSDGGLPPGRKFDDEFLITFFDTEEEAKWELDETDWKRWQELKLEERTHLWTATRTREEGVQRRIETAVEGYMRGLRGGIDAFADGVETYAGGTETVIRESDELLRIYNEWSQEGGMRDVMWWVDLAEAVVGIGRLAVNLGEGTVRLIARSLGSADEGVDVGRAAARAAGAADETGGATGRAARATDEAADAATASNAGAGRRVVGEANDIYDGVDLAEFEKFVESVLGRSFDNFDEALPLVARHLGYYMDFSQTQKNWLLELATKATLAARGNRIDFDPEALAWLHRMGQSEEFWENLAKAASLDIDARIYRLVDEVELGLLRRLANSPEAASAARSSRSRTPPAGAAGAADEAAETVRMPPPGGADEAAETVRMPPPGGAVDEAAETVRIPPPASAVRPLDPAVTLPPPGAATLPRGGTPTLPPPSARAAMDEVAETVRMPPPGGADEAAETVRMPPPGGAVDEAAETVRIPPPTGAVDEASETVRMPTPMGAGTRRPRVGESAASPVSLNEIGATGRGPADATSAAGTSDAVRTGLKGSRGLPGLVSLAQSLGLDRGGER